MNNIEYYNQMNNYANEIRSDIAHEFGLESAGYAPRNRKGLTTKQAMYLNDKYGFDKAMVIAKRYAQMLRKGVIA